MPERQTKLPESVKREITDGVLTPNETIVVGTVVALLILGISLAMTWRDSVS